MVPVVLAHSVGFKKAVPLISGVGFMTTTVDAFDEGQVMAGDV